MSAAVLTQVSQESAPLGVLSDTQHDPHIYMTIGRMLDFCNQRPMSQPFTARGVVIDTTADIAEQLREYFPPNIDLTLLIDRITEVCLERAKATAQPLQVVSFDHLKQVKPIESDDGNMDTFIEVFADRRMKISNYMGHKTALKAGAGGGAGGDPHQMLAELRQADIQGFALQVKSLDISDAKATELLSKMGIAHAFGGDSAAIGGALETITKGGPEAKAMQAVIEQVAEIKTLRTALANAPDAAAAQPIAAAIALKVEALAPQIPAIQTASPQLGAAMKANITQTLEAVKTTLTARQMEIAVTQLSQALPASIIKVANDLGRNTMSVQVARAVEAVNTVARASNLNVRDVIALTLTQNATPAMTQAVQNLTAIMAKPDFLPTIEKGIPPQVALSVREVLIVPPVQATLAVPVSIAQVAQTLRSLGEQSNHPTVKSAAVVLNIADQQAGYQNVSPSLRAPQLQAVVDNLQAAALSSATPPAMKAELQAVTAQVQVLTVQARNHVSSPAFADTPSTPSPLPPQSPLAAVAHAVNVQAPGQIPPAQPAIAEFKGAPNHWGESPNVPSARPLQQPSPVPPAVNDPRIGTVITAPAAMEPRVQPSQPQAPQSSPVHNLQIHPVQVTPTHVQPQAQPVHSAPAQTVTAPPIQAPPAQPAFLQPVQPIASMPAPAAPVHPTAAVAVQPAQAAPVQTVPQVQPSAAQPVAAQPAQIPPVAAQPQTAPTRIQPQTSPIAAQPVATQPQAGHVQPQPQAHLTAQPATVQPAQVQPVVAQPQAGSMQAQPQAQPVTVQPAQIQTQAAPVHVQPAQAQPQAPQPVAAQPVQAQPQASQPTAAQPQAAPVPVQPQTQSVAQAQPVQPQASVRIVHEQPQPQPPLRQDTETGRRAVVEEQRRYEEQPRRQEETRRYEEPQRETQRSSAWDSKPSSDPTKMWGAREEVKPVSSWATPKTDTGTSLFDSKGGGATGDKKQPKPVNKCDGCGGGKGCCPTFNDSVLAKVSDNALKDYTNVDVKAYANRSWKLNPA